MYTPHAGLSRNRLTNTGANVSETTDPANRTQWPHTGGSVAINGSHEWALTYVNLGLGTNVSAFNITLVESFNQTGAGVLCLKEAGKAALEEGFRESNISMDAMEGLHATVQVIQISHTGASLYNVRFAVDMRIGGVVLICVCSARI